MYLIHTKYFLVNLQTKDKR